MEVQTIQQKIYEARGQKVMFDFDLAELFGVETRVINQAVKRNIARFPEDYTFQLTTEEFTNLKSQSVISSWGGKRKLPFVFTEHGVVALPFILRSDRAVKVSDAIVRAFVALRTLALTTAGLAAHLRLLEEKYDKQFADVNEILNFLMAEKKHGQDWGDRERIGFIKEEEIQYSLS